MRNHLSSVYNYFFNSDQILGSKRLSWIDYAKGLTIILVVYHHSFLTLVNAGVKVNYWLINLNLSVYSFRMPMFFILSGLFIEKSLKKRGPKKYIQTRAQILLYPYILWAILQATFGIVFSQYTHATWNLQRYLVIFYQPNATSQLWYLITLFNTALLYVLLRTKLRFRPQHQFIFGVLLYMISPFLFFNSMIQDTTRFYVYLVFGSLISNFILAEKNFKILSSIRLFVPLSILMGFSQYYLFKNQYLYSLEMYFNFGYLSFITVLLHFWGMLKFTAIVLIGCAFVLNMCCILQKLGGLGFIRIIGYHSLYIYLMHVLIAVGCRMVLVNLLQYDNVFVILPLQIIGCVLGSIMIYNLCKHLGLTLFFQFNSEQFKRFIKKINISPKYQKV